MRAPVGRGGRRGVMFGRAIWTGGFAAIVLTLMIPASRGQAEPAFPFERELLLDVKPMPGSKRVPSLEIDAKGRASVDLWCKSGTAQADIGEGTIVFSLGPMRDGPCAPERASKDEELIAALSQATAWKWDGQKLTLSGSTVLRYRAASN